ncbi:MAG: hypothetical protein HXY38_00905 [Chloroflexi bacterium]|nr:hypothetical protein [Chloroflexota bacterium]
MPIRSQTTQQTLLLAIITILAYGLLLPFTGFYWDDWPFAWIAQFLGPAEFIPAFMPFRPFLGPVFYLTTSLIAPIPLYWQVFALIIRFLIGITAWWMFQQIFPNRKTLPYLAALLMLVFPGYSQHWVALTHINQELIPFLFYLLSFGFTFKSIRTQKQTDITIALLLQICGIFPTEYFFGIEGIRFLLLLSVLPGTLSQRVTKTLKVWLPHLLLWVLNAAWLAFYYRFGPYNSYEVAAASTPNILSFLTQALDALWKAGFFIWIQVLVLSVSSLPAPASLLTLGLVALSFFFLTRFLLRSAKPDEPNEKAILIYLIPTGILGILLGRLPSLAANLPLTLQSSYDRFMISIMLGATLFIIAILELLIKNHRLRIMTFSALIALGIGQQFFNANIFRRDWQQQGNIYWQMAWRIPALKPNTVLLTHQMPIDYETDLSFTAPINWMYAPEYTRSDLPYMLLYTEKRIGGSTLPSLERDAAIQYPYRTVNFESSTSNVVVIYMPPNGCLRVLDPQRGHTDIYDNIAEPFTQSIPLSDPSRIIIEGNRSALPMFFPEPAANWCFYFTQAELANQRGDYSAAAQLGNEAFHSGLRPSDPREWLVFIEAYAMNGDRERALDISQQALKKDSKMLKAVCMVWEFAKAQGHAGSAQDFEAAILSLNCSP